MNPASSEHVKKPKPGMTEGGTAIGERVSGVPANSPAAAARAPKTVRVAHRRRASSTRDRIRSQQIRGKPLMTFLVGLVLGAGIASLWGSQSR